VCPRARTRENTYLLRIAREVVGGLAGAGVALGDLGVAAVVGLENAELPARGVLQLDVELAVPAVAGGRDTDTSLGHEAVVQQSHGGQVARQLAGNGAGRAARAGKGNGLDLDLVARGTSGRQRRGEGRGGEDSEGREELHDCELESWSQKGGIGCVCEEDELERRGDECAKMMFWCSLAVEVEVGDAA
jgi:hypothetical protein